MMMSWIIITIFVLASTAVSLSFDSSKTYWYPFFPLFFHSIIIFLHTHGFFHFTQISLDFMHLHFKSPAPWVFFLSVLLFTSLFLTIAALTKGSRQVALAPTGAGSVSELALAQPHGRTGQSERVAVRVPTLIDSHTVGLGLGSPSAWLFECQLWYWLWPS